MVAAGDLFVCEGWFKTEAQGLLAVRHVHGLQNTPDT
jgi:hypothetical protein